MRTNETVLWKNFDPQWYFNLHYETLRDDDRQIIRMVRDFFAKHAKGMRNARGVDVGTGSNLYPALTMLPFCRSIHLHDPVENNLEWLKNTIEADDKLWNACWSVLTQHRVYANINDHWGTLRERYALEARSVLVPRQPEWNIGTMFFVAESITEDKAEFRRALRNFLSGLLPGSPFAIGMVEGSEGYPAGEDSARYPAVDITIDDASEALANVSEGLELHQIPTPPSGPFRCGYRGMLLALGRTK